MRTIAKKSGAEISGSMPFTAKEPDIAPASVPDTLAEVDSRRKEHGYNEVVE